MTRNMRKPEVEFEVVSGLVRLRLREPGNGIPSLEGGKTLLTFVDSCVGNPGPALTGRGKGF